MAKKEAVKKDVAPAAAARKTAARTTKASAGADTAESQAAKPQTVRSKATSSDAAKTGTVGTDAAKPRAARSRNAKTEAAPRDATDAADAPVKKAASALLTVTDISEHLAQTFEIPRSHARAYLVETVALMSKHLKKGAKVRVSGLGIFQVKKRAARKGRNPATGDAMRIKASKRVAFTVARDLKAKL